MIWNVGDDGGDGCDFCDCYSILNVIFINVLDSYSYFYA